jgi:hypothetical protein
VVAGGAGDGPARPASGGHSGQCGPGLLCRMRIWCAWRRPGSGRRRTIRPSCWPTCPTGAVRVTTATVTLSAPPLLRDGQRPAQLHATIAAYAREETWAPQGSATSAADTSTKRPRPMRRTPGSCWAHRKQLESIDEARTGWYARTADAHAAADRARTELRRRETRGLDMHSLTPPIVVEPSSSAWTRQRSSIPPTAADNSANSHRPQRRAAESSRRHPSSVSGRNRGQSPTKTLPSTAVQAASSPTTTSPTRCRPAARPLHRCPGPAVDSVIREILFVCHVPNRYLNMDAGQRRRGAAQQPVERRYGATGQSHRRNPLPLYLGCQARSCRSLPVSVVVAREGRPGRAEHAHVQHGGR